MAPSGWGAILSRYPRHGLTNVYAALQAGVRQFDASAGGLGVVPSRPAPKVMCTTEDVVMLCESIGYDTGLDSPSF